MTKWPSCRRCQAGQGDPAARRGSTLTGVRTRRPSDRLLRRFAEVGPRTVRQPADTAQPRPPWGAVRPHALGSGILPRMAAPPLDSLLDPAYVGRMEKFLSELIWMAKVLRHGRENIALE